MYVKKNKNLTQDNTVTQYWYKGLKGISKQEAHGPHRSPEKPVKINKHISSEL